jgi:hypothetical protein
VSPAKRGGQGKQHAAHDRHRDAVALKKAERRTISGPRKNRVLASARVSSRLRSNVVT